MLPSSGSLGKRFTLAHRGSGTFANFCRRGKSGHGRLIALTRNAD